MGWEKRNGRTYFYLSKKLPDGRVGKQYYGQGLLAEIESIRLEKFHADRLMIKQEKARFFAADLHVQTHFKLVDELCSATLIASGYYNPKSRGWRKIGMSESIEQVPQDQVTEFDEARFTEIVKAAKAGDRSVVPELRAMLIAHPELQRNDGDLSSVCQLQWMHRITGQNHYLRQCLILKVQKLKRQLTSEGTGSTIEAMIIDQIVTCWLQLNYTDALEAKSPAKCIQLADYQLRRIESISKRQLKALELLAKFRVLKPTLVVERVTVIEAETPDPEVQFTNTSGTSPHHRFESSFGESRMDQVAWN